MRVGSSPHMRGKRERHRGHWERVRIIPAHAGQTCICCALRCPAADHPRTCGTNGQFDAFKRPVGGSSPHMRGKLPCVLVAADCGRIIPAHAGQTMDGRLRISSIMDHPRTCGANACYVGVGVGSRGSSPHMRGKQTQIWNELVNFRIIPAHAGQTNMTTFTNLPDTDHPRTCGANGFPVASSHFFFGSSPHMRGKRTLLEYP